MSFALHETEGTVLLPGKVYHLSEIAVALCGVSVGGVAFKNLNPEWIKRVLVPSHLPVFAEFDGKMCLRCDTACTPSGVFIVLCFELTLQ
jgi:hypothetical protein